MCQNDVNECLRSPCHNGATCLNTHGSFHCNCTIQASGSLCDELLVPPITKGAVLGFELQELAAIVGES